MRRGGRRLGGFLHMAIDRPILVFIIWKGWGYLYVQFVM